jgi:site-specific recombinase XerD
MPVAKPKFTLYKHVKIDGEWRYCRAIVASNNKVKPHIVLVRRRRGTARRRLVLRPPQEPMDRRRNDPAEALRLRTQMSEQKDSADPRPLAAKGTALAAASEKYFSNLEARGVDAGSIRTYRSAVDPFAKTCKKELIEQVEKQDMIDFMGWLRKQPLPRRRHSNPERTYNNKVGHVAIFLKAFGVSELLKKNEYPKYRKKQIVAHTDDELGLLYSHADPEEWFLLDFFLGTMARDAEAANCRYTDLTATTLTLFGKQRKTRTVEITPRLAAAIEDRGKRSKSEYLFPNRSGRPDQHLLRRLQRLAKRAGAGAKFHTELHKLRKTGASRRYRAGVLLLTLMSELGHESLAVTQIYLADLKMEETKKAVADADFVPKPRLVSGTNGD